MGPAIHLSTASRRLVIAAARVSDRDVDAGAARGPWSGGRRAAARTVSATIAALDAHQRASVAVHAYRRCEAGGADGTAEDGVPASSWRSSPLSGLLGTVRRRWRAFEVPAPVVGLTCAGQGSRAPPVAAFLR